MTHRLLIIAILGTLGLNGCLGTPRVETSIYEGPEGAVLLKTVPDESRAASHPANLSRHTLETVLRGIHYRESGRFLQNLVNRDAAPTPLFSPSEIKFLAPHLQHAFSQVTREESVIIRMPAPSSSDVQNIIGSLSVKENKLHIIFTFSNRGPFTQTKSKVTVSDPREFTSPTLVFLPKDAVTKDSESPWYKGTQNPHRLIIDLAKLASLPQDAAHPHVAPDAIPSATATPTQKLERSSPSDANDLLQEIRSLRRELSKQKQEIERLKKREGEPR